MSQPACSYIITNRKHPPTTLFPQTPLPGDELWWYRSTSEVNDQNDKNFSSVSDTASAKAPSEYSSTITAQLQTQTQPSLTVFVHGLDCDWKSAVKYTGVLGANLASAGYEGLVIGFSWPSMGLRDLVDYSNDYPPRAKAGTARGNIAASVASFGSFVAWLQTLKTAIAGLIVNIVCHSEGNFMLMTGLAGDAGRLAAHTIMIAADINDGAFITPAVGLAGQAANIAAFSGQVTVYYSTNDPILAFSIGVYGGNVEVPGSGFYHNPAFGGRLGLMGPAYDQGAQQPNLTGVDCSGVINDQYVGSLPVQNPPDIGTGLHMAYLYVPVVLADIVQALTGTAPTHRTAVANPNSCVLNPT